MWSVPEIGTGNSSGRMDYSTVPVGGQARSLFLFSGQPSVGWTDGAVGGDGRKGWTLQAHAAGVALFGMESLPVEVSLPGGVAVELAHEPVPAANKLDVYKGALLGGGGGWGTTYAHWIDTCLALRVRAAGAVVAEGRLQHDIRNSAGVPSPFPGGAFRLSAGYYVDAAGQLRVYAHAGNLAVAVGLYSGAEDAPSIPDTTTVGRRLVGPFGRGITLTASAATVANPVGAVAVTAAQNSYLAAPALSWFAHARPLEERISLAPDSLPITQRPRDRLAWGRHRALVAVGPIGWGLSAVEAEGHPEWQTGASGVSANLRANPWVAHPGASRLFDGGQPFALVPPSPAVASNVSATPADNQRLATLRASWTDGSGWSTGTRDLGLLFGAWNEYRPTAWLSHSGTYTPPGGSAGTINGAFLGVSIQRIDATNLGGITDPADAVEVTRLRVGWLAAIRVSTPDPFGGPDVVSWVLSQKAAILAPADAAALLAGNPVTVANSYVQGTYPTTTSPDLYGTLTLQAIG